MSAVEPEPEPPEMSDETAVVFGAAAHEIKNALGPLAMTLQLAERQLLAGQPIPPVELAFAREQVRRISRLVGDLMDLTRADLRQLVMRTIEADLVAVVVRAVETFRRGHTERVVVVAQSQPTSPIMSTLDEARIEQVLLNLLENAARYSPADAAISVGIARSGDATTRVTVTDRGPGLAADEHERIFERFVRGSASEGSGGLGIGLYLCRLIVERHGGLIGVDSTVGAGATFWFELPCR